ncbi:MAG: prepilin-type N-terminal cleavage/methylation domain-containing protein [Fimbriimonadales bacterium]|nr:prepilin-type N-terminal cleavage/methylation domain-containing protein [Fimbriimonadales bacterium]
MNNVRQVKKGFTLVEVVVSVALLAIGIVVSLGSLSAMTKTEVKLRKTEEMNRLAVQKIEEVLAVGNATTAETSGTFDDYGYTGYEWSLDVAPSGTENLDTIRVTVTEASANSSAGVSVSSLLYTPPNTTGATN